MNIPAPHTDQQVLRRVRIKLGAQVAAVITVVVLMLGCLSYCLFQDRQQADIRRALDYSLEHGSPDRPDPCIWLFVQRAGQLDQPAQHPPGFPLATALRRAAQGRPAQTDDVARNGTHYIVVTEERSGAVRQAVFDERYQSADRHQMLTVLLIAELVGLGLALATGAILAERAISPLSRALVKQREFVADASHELRTPLTRMHTRAQLLLRGEQDRFGAGTAEELQRLVAGSAQLAEVLDDLLLSASLTPLSTGYERLDLSVLAAEVVEAERARAAQQQLTLELRAPGQPALVHGIASPLRRMISSLVDNALGHTRPGGLVQVVVEVIDRGHTVELTVADDGVGFDPADRGRIFERLARGTQGSGHRFGLGLALVSTIVENHGGTISATSRPGKGSTFTVLLPSATRHIRPAEAQPAPFEVQRRPITGTAGPRPSRCPGSSRRRGRRWVGCRRG
ncbi:HAMP domain-containing sensor histidine kinase [Streptacidiphilus sp. N1-10]|uniref:histidine kinase n=1 Tax=Streptacidiphilus jeojiensis TaxID=3229225 RepID=A0ABV6XFF1_9ACTN